MYFTESKLKLKCDRCSTIEDMSNRCQAEVRVSWVERDAWGNGFEIKVNGNWCTKCTESFSEWLEDSKTTISKL